MSLIYSITPANNVLEVQRLFFQNWAPMPNPHHNEMYYYPNAGLTPDPEMITFKIKDVIGALETQQYSEFRLLAYQNYLTGNPLPWIDPDSYTDIGYPNSESDPMAITENGMEFEFTPVLQNLNLLAVGSYRFYHHFKIQGKLGSSWVDISSYEHRIRLFVTNFQYSISPQHFLFQHLQGNPLPTRNIFIYGENWKIIGNPKVVLSSTTSGTTVEEFTDDTGTWQEVTLMPGGGGTGSFDIRLGEFYDQIGTFDPSVLSGYVTVMAGSSTIAGYVTYDIQVSAQPGLTVSTSQLNFLAIKGISEAPPQNIIFLCTQAYTITSSPWLSTAVVTESHDGLLTTQIVVTPADSFNMSVGIYTGFVEISTVIAGNTVTETVAVTYEVAEFLSSPYPGGVAFTLDPQEFNFSTVIPDTYFQFNLEVIAFSFFNSDPKSFSVQQKLMPFQGKTAIGIGKLIHSMMDRFAEVNTNYFQYKPAEVTITCEERRIGDHAVVRAAAGFQILFVAGLGRPPGVLDVNSLPKRVLPEGFTNVNLYVPAGSHTFLVQKNGQTLLSIPVSATEPCLMTKQISFSGAKQGDVFQCRLSANDPSATKPGFKQFIVFPEGKNRFMVYWENDWLLQSDLEFTGKLTLGGNLERTTHRPYKNLVEALEILAVNNVNKLTINTGWIMQSDVDSIYGLLRSKRVWIESANGKVSLRPLTESIVQQDTMRGLVEYAIEFQINKKYNEETYSF